MLSTLGIAGNRHGDSRIGLVASPAIKACLENRQASFGIEIADDGELACLRAEVLAIELHDLVVFDVPQPFDGFLDRWNISDIVS